MAARRRSPRPHPADEGRQALQAGGSADYCPGSSRAREGLPRVDGTALFEPETRRNRPGDRGSWARRRSFSVRKKQEPRLKGSKGGAKKALIGIKAPAQGGEEAKGGTLHPGRSRD